MKPNVPYLGGALFGWSKWPNMARSSVWLVYGTVRAHFNVSRRFLLVWASREMHPASHMYALCAVSISFFLYFWDSISNKSPGSRLSKLGKNYAFNVPYLGGTLFGWSKLPNMARYSVWHRATPFQRLKTIPISVSISRLRRCISEP